MITYETLLAEYAKHRAAFGWMLCHWRAANNWGIYGPSRLAESRGFRPVPYGLWQQLESGAAGELQSATFMALGELNQQPDIAQIVGWGPTDFWACYCGLRPVPARWRLP